MIKRIKCPDGNGSGLTVFSGNYFDVTYWKYDTEPVTEVRIRHSDTSFYFKGHANIKTDKACFEHTSYLEFKEMLKRSERRGFKNGKNKKSMQIKDCLSYEY